MNVRCVGPAVLAAALSAPFADATTLTFEDLAHGQIVTSQYSALGVTVSAVNPNRSFDVAAVFDTRLAGTADPDLEDPFDGGNAQTSVLGNVLVISESDEDPEQEGFVIRPDDEGNRPGGRLVFELDRPSTFLGFDLLDIEAGPEANGSRVEFYRGATLVSMVDFTALSSMTPGIFFGDNFANRVEPFSVGSPWDRVEFVMGGSGGIDNVSFTPEPGLLVVLSLGGVALAATRRSSRVDD